LARRIKRSRYGDDVNGDVAKTGDTSSLHCRFQLCVNDYCIPLYQLLTTSF